MSHVACCAMFQGLIVISVKPKQPQPHGTLTFVVARERYQPHTM